LQVAVSPIWILKHLWHHLLITFLLNWYPATVCV